MLEEDGEENAWEGDVPERVNDSRSSMHLFAFCSDDRKSLAREDSYKRVKHGKCCRKVLLVLRMSIRFLITPILFLAISNSESTWRR